MTPPVTTMVWSVDHVVECVRVGSEKTKGAGR